MGLLQPSWHTATAFFVMILVLMIALMITLRIKIGKLHFHNHRVQGKYPCLLLSITRNLLEHTLPNCCTATRVKIRGLCGWEIPENPCWNPLGPGAWLSHFPARSLAALLPLSLSASLLSLSLSLSLSVRSTCHCFAGRAKMLKCNTSEICWSVTSFFLETKQI